MDLSTFVIDENVGIWVQTLCRVDRQGIRFTHSTPYVDETRALELMVRIHRQGRALGVSDELQEAYARAHRALILGDVPLGATMDGHLKIARARGRLITIATPREIPTGGIPRKDLFIVRLAAHLECNLVTEDQPLLAALSESNRAGKLGFRALSLDDALTSL